jgi:hypothetical protein
VSETGNPKNLLCDNQHRWIGSMESVLYHPNYYPRGLAEVWGPMACGNVSIVVLFLFFGSA